MKNRDRTLAQDRLATASQVRETSETPYPLSTVKGSPLKNTEFLVGVYYNVGPGDDRFVQYARCTADMGRGPPEPPITDAEMQHVLHAAKFAMAKVLMDRKKKR